MTDIGDQAPHKPVVGLALGSGSARGWAHIGMNSLTGCSR